VAASSYRIGADAAPRRNALHTVHHQTSHAAQPLLLRVGPNTKIDAHAHPDDRVGTVVSGTWFFGYGREFDEKALKALPPGSFYTEPPGMHHFAMTRDEGVVIQISGTGPSGTSYADPKNDPAKKP